MCFTLHKHFENVFFFFNSATKVVHLLFISLGNNACFAFIVNISSTVHCQEGLTALNKKPTFYFSYFNVRIIITIIIKKKIVHPMNERISHLMCTPNFLEHFRHQRRVSKLASTQLAINHSNQMLVLYF